MAKPKPQPREITIDDVLDKAIDATDNRVFYANNMRFAVSANEVTLDFYFLGAPTAQKQAPEARRIARIVLPVNLSKEIAEIILDGVSTWEETFGINLPLKAQQPPNLSEESMVVEDE
jgi:hypothetical protein